MWRSLAVSLLVILPVTAYTQKTEFSADSAYTQLKTLVNVFGPRTMGSPSERQAVNYAIERFRDCGCQEAYAMPMTVAGGVNTTSAVAVGILKGQTGRMIVIGGHIDSSDPEVPGANDDGSGVACVLELARVLGGRQHHSTLVFCCFPGEERGLRGSSYFVDHFPLIDSVDLMLQIDMADGSSDLLLLPDGNRETSAPPWLVKAAYDTYFRELGYVGMVYETHAMTLTSASANGALSDHGPFLQKGIPAVDFTSDIDYPIHTAFDDLSTFVPSGLQRSGDLVLRLVERYDGGVPSRETDRYWLFQAGTHPVIVGYTAIRVFVVLSIATLVVALVMLWKRRPPRESSVRVRWSGIKMALFALIIQSLVWVSPDVVGIIKGYRFPWVNNYGGFVVLGVLFGLIGVWCSVRMAFRLRLSSSPFAFAVRSSVLLLLFTILFGLLALELALYPGLSLLCVSGALLIRNSWVKGVLVIAAPVPIVRLMFNENTIMLQRAVPAMVTGDLTSRLVSTIVFIFIFTLLSLPFMYAAAAVYRDACTDLFWLKRLGMKKSVPGLITIAIGVLVIILLNRPVYNSWWPAQVRAEERYTYGKAASTVRIASSDRLEGVRLMVDAHDTLLEGSGVEFTPRLGGNSQVPWLVISSTTEAVKDSSATDSLVTLRRHLLLKSVLRPYKVSVTYRSSGPLVASSPWQMRNASSMQTPGDEVQEIAWDSFPDTVLNVPVVLTSRAGIPVREYIEVLYDTLSYPLSLRRDDTWFTYRTYVSRVDTVRPD